MPSEGGLNKFKEKNIKRVKQKNGHSNYIKHENFLYYFLFSAMNTIILNM